MKFYLFNFTDNTILLNSDCCGNDSELCVLPEASAAIPSGKQKFVMSVGATTPEKVFEIERQYIFNLSELSLSRTSLLTMPEHCPWRIYRHQVTSPALS